MAVRNGPRKRYLLLTSESHLSNKMRRRFAGLMLSRHPELAKRLIWFSRGVIVKTDTANLEELKKTLRMKIEGISLNPALTSGSIGKLKRFSHFDDRDCNDQERVGSAKGFERQARRKPDSAWNSTIATEKR